MSTTNEMLSRLAAKQEEARKSRDTFAEKRAAIVQLADDEARTELNDDEQREFDALTEQIKALDEEVTKRGERIAELDAEEKRAMSAGAAFKKAQIVSAARVTSESRTYEKGNGRSYLADLALAQVKGDPEARARLDRHAIEVATEPEYRDLNRTDTTGGYFVPPAWMMSDYVALARAGRPTANLVTNQPLPAGTDSINIPKVSTGTATAIQTADNASVQETDLADATVSAGVKTIAGQQDVAFRPSSSSETKATARRPRIVASVPITSAARSRLNASTKLRKGTSVSCVLQPSSRTTGEDAAGPAT